MDLQPTKNAHSETQSLRVKINEVSSHDNKLIVRGITPKGDDIQIILGGVWAQNHISSGSTVHVIDARPVETKGTYEVDSKHGILVVDPDNLLTCTLIASALFCERKTWLNNVFLGEPGTNKAMLVGTLVHEIFQYGVKNKIVDIDKLIAFMDELLDDATLMLEIYSVEKHISEIREEAIAYISSVREWIESYMFSGPNVPLTNAPDLEVKVAKICDIEENVWSTKYGLKGKIDVTGLVKVHDKRNKTVTEKVIPLELKTGNPNLSSSHSAQVSLYSMMIEDRYAETNQGFVIYLKNKAAMHNVALTSNIKRDLIQRRNEVSHFMKSYFSGPEMLNQSRVCKNCERLTECILTSNLYQPGRISEYPVMKELESEATGHLDAKFLAFFKQYHEKLVAMLSQGSASAKIGANNSFWTYSSREAELRGTGFGNLQAIPSDDKRSIKFIRHPKHVDTQEESVNETINGSGVKKPALDEVDLIVIDDSDDTQKTTNKKPPLKKMKINDYFRPMKRNLESQAEPETPLSSQIRSQTKSQPEAKPFDTSLNFSRCRIAISLDQPEQTMDSQNSTTAIAIGFMNDLKGDSFTLKLYEGTWNHTDSDLMYRVDKLEKRSNLDIERTVLVKLLAKESWRCERIRRLLLDSDYKPKNKNDLQLYILSNCFDEISELTSKQQKFVVSAVATESYAIMDENVETSQAQIDKTISVTAQVLRVIGKSLLIVAQNIDHLVDLMRLLQRKKLSFIMIDDGTSTKARYQYASNLVKVCQLKNVDLSKKFDAYIRAHEKAEIVITTYAMSLGGLLFTRRTFDYCVAYDCDKTELLVSLSPMFCSDKIIIIDSNNPVANQKKSEDDITLGAHLRNLHLVEY